MTDVPEGIDSAERGSASVGTTGARTVSRGAREGGFGEEECGGRRSDSDGRWVGIDCGEVGEKGEVGAKIDDAA